MANMENKYKHMDYVQSAISIRTVRGEPLISYKLSLIVLFYQQRALCAKVSVL